MAGPNQQLMPERSWQGYLTPGLWIAWITTISALVGLVLCTTLIALTGLPHILYGASLAKCISIHVHA